MRIERRPALYAAASFASAFLLFLIQPMIAKAITPEYGGSASVWTSALLVGQTLLLLGTLYAYKLVSSANWIMPRNANMAAAILVALLLLALPEYALQRPLPDWVSGFRPEVGVPLLMVASVGPAMLLLGGMSPVLQRSWSRTSGDANPYPLYAASNAGSLLGLLSYPFVIEATVGTTTQLQAWKVTTAVVILACAALVKSGPAMTSSTERTAFQPLDIKRLPVSQWFVPSTLAVIIMMAAGQAVTSDVMAMPLTWVLPLAAFLVGYMTAFSRKQSSDFKRSLKIPQAGLLLLAAAAANPLFLANPNVGALTVVAIGLVTHGLMREVYETRPKVEDLGKFYLTIALGGAVGGFIVAVLAPLILDWRWELPVALVASAYALRPAPSAWKASSAWKMDKAIKTVKVVVTVMAIAAGLLSIVLQMASRAGPAQMTGVLLTILAVAILSAHSRRAFAFWTLWLMLGMGLVSQGMRTAEGESRRSYYGIMSIESKSVEKRPALTLTHGTTVHGLQMLDQPEEPTSYYTPTSGIGDAMRALSTKEVPNIAIAGLGAGTLACLAPQSSNMTFFEIDPEIVEAAQEDFTFIDRCAPSVKIKLGDARMLIRDEAREYDLLVLDAFASDSIPMHLVTREALDIYESRLAPNGWLLIHTSNRYLDVSSPVSAWAHDAGYDAMILHDKNTAQGTKSDSVWMAIRPDGWKEKEKDWTADPRWKPVTGGTMWTDDRSSILRIIKSL